MSRQVNYTGEFVEYSGLQTEPQFAAQSILQNKVLPQNFIALSQASKAYRDLTLAYLLLGVDNRDELVDTMCRFMRGAPDGGTTVQVMTEYAASIAYALEHKDLAIEMITRNDPAHVTPFVWSMVSAIKKGMPGLMYQGLITSNVHNANIDWAATKESIIDSL